MTHKIIIDTDPGIDDTLAIFYAIESGAFDIVGLTTVFGNVDAALATQNALRLLEIAGCTHIPVAQGASAPLARPYRGPVPQIHGEDGQGNCRLDPPAGKRIEQTAAEFIVAQVMSYPGEITLVPIGPLTNLAAALQLQPEIAGKVRGVVLMGGAALVPGNITPAAEANIYSDPEAADLVFAAGWDVTMVGLDVTHRVLMSHEQLGLYARSAKATSLHISRILPLYVAFAEKVLGRPALYMHDPTAVSYLLNPSLFKTERLMLKVETQGVSRGKTWVWSQTRSFPPEWSGATGSKPVTVVLDADVDAVNRMLLDTV